MRFTAEIRRFEEGTLFGNTKILFYTYNMETCEVGAENDRFSGHKAAFSPVTCSAAIMLHGDNLLSATSAST